MKLKYTSILLITSWVILTACNSGNSSGQNSSSLPYNGGGDESIISPATQYLLSDSFNCINLPTCNSSNPNYLSCVSTSAITNCNSLQSLNNNGMTLNDSRNTYISGSSQDFITIGTPPDWQTSESQNQTLFAAYTLTYNPDVITPANLVGYPVQDQSIQQFAQSQESLGTCAYYVDNTAGEKDYTPWVSHCSAFAAWAVNSVYSQDIPPLQPRGNLGYDWCGLADANSQGLASGQNNWRNVESSSFSANSNYTSVQAIAQALANAGCGVVANFYNTSGAGHIGVILPNTWQVAQSMQSYSAQLSSPNYPLNVPVSDPTSFQQFLQMNGPEEMQAGLYNFQHTTTFNGFYSELNPPLSPVNDAQVMANFSSVIYYYNTTTCNY